MNLLSRVAGGIKRALRGVLVEEAFKGGNVNRFLLDWVTMGGLSADDEIRQGLRRLVVRSRDLGRNNWAVKQWLNLLSLGFVGPDGFALEATNRLRGPNGEELDDLDEKLNDYLERRWCRWADRPVTVDGKLALVDLERLLVKTAARDGEAFVRIWRGFKDNEFRYALEPIDRDLVDDTYTRPWSREANEIRMGVEVDSYGRPLFYHVWNTLDQGKQRIRQRIPADQIVHIYDPDRVMQTRGVPWNAAVLVDLKMLAGYIEAELVAARAGAAKMAFFVRKDGLAADIPQDQELTMDANPGTIDFAPDGYSVETFDPDHPTTAFPDFTKALLRFIACGLHISYPSLSGDLEAVNFGSMRGGKLDERDYYRWGQGWFSRSFLDRIYGDWLDTAWLAGQVELPATVDTSLYAEATWTGRGFPWVDPLKDVQAAVLAITNGLGSRTNYLREQGREFKKNLKDLEEEKRLAEEVDVPILAALPAGSIASDNADGSDGNGDSNGNGNGNGKGKPKGKAALNSRIKQYV